MLSTVITYPKVTDIPKKDISETVVNTVYCDETLEGLNVTLVTTLNNQIIKIIRFSPLTADEFPSILISIYSIDSQLSAEGYKTTIFTVSNEEKCYSHIKKFAENLQNDSLQFTIFGNSLDTNQKTLEQINVKRIITADETINNASITIIDKTKLKDPLTDLRVFKDNCANYYDLFYLMRSLPKASREKTDYNVLKLIN